MENSTKLYWLTRLDSVQGLCIALSIISLITVMLYWIVYAVNSDFEDEDWNSEYKSTYGSKAKIATWMGIICMLIVTLIPTRAEMIFIVAGGKTMDFVEKDSSIQKIPSQTTKIVSEYLDKKIKEIEASEK